MSITSHLSRIQADKSTIRNQLVAFGLVESTADLDDLAAAIEGIENRGAVSAQVQEGDTYTIPKGYHNGCLLYTSMDAVITGRANRTGSVCTKYSLTEM